MSIQAKVERHGSANQEAEAEANWEREQVRSELEAGLQSEGVLLGDPPRDAGHEQEGAETSQAEGETAHAGSKI